MKAKLRIAIAVNCILLSGLFVLNPVPSYAAGEVSQGCCKTSVSGEKFCCQWGQQPPYCSCVQNCSHDGQCRLEPE